jgi:hypothetical protein
MIDPLFRGMPGSSIESATIMSLVPCLRPLPRVVLLSGHDHENLPRSEGQVLGLFTNGQVVHDIEPSPSRLYLVELTGE